MNVWAFNILPLKISESGNVERRTFVMRGLRVVIQLSVMILAAIFVTEEQKQWEMTNKSVEAVVERLSSADFHL